MNSELVKSVFEDELERTKRLVRRYEEEIAALPKGSVFTRQIGRQSYFYLSYREDSRTVSKFLGNVKDFRIEELEQKLNRRKELSALLKKLDTDRKSLEKELLK